MYLFDCVQRGEDDHISHLIYTALIFVFLMNYLAQDSVAANNPGYVSAVIEVFRDTGMVPYTVLFNALNSSSPNGNIVRYDWDFNESNVKYPMTDEGRMVGHMFNSSGTFNVSLTVTDSAGYSNKTSILITVVPVPGTAKTYYIASDGNDSNNGTSSISPWKTTAKINSMAASMPDGSQILFRRGDTFDLKNNTWHLDTNLIRSGPEYIRLGAYGTGNKPTIYCENCSSDGTINTNQRTEGNGIIIEDIHFTGFLWLMPSYYSMTEPHGFRKPGLQIIVRNLDLYPDGNLGVWSSSGVTMEDCYVNNTQSGVGFGASNWPGIDYFYANHIEVENAYSHCVYFADTGRNILFENGDLHDCGIYGLLRDGFTVHGVFDNVIVRNNSIHHNGYAMGIIDGYLSNVPSEIMSNFIVEDNRIYNQVSFGIQLSSIENFIFRNNLVYNNSIGTSINSIVLLLTPNNMEGLIDNSSINVSFYNNVFYNNEYTIFNIRDDQVSDVEIRNNIFMNNNPDGEYFLNIENESDVNISNNIYYNNIGPAFSLSGVVRNLAVWLSSGHDSNSLDDNPLFADVSHSNFRLLESSPAIDAGISVDAYYDHLGGSRSLDSSFDIGAYEYLVIFNPSIRFSSSGSDKIVSQNWIYLNISANYTAPRNVTLQWNGINQTVSCTGIPTKRVCLVNKTNLTDGNYSYIAYINGTGLSKNSTEKRYIGIDTRYPEIDFSSSMSANGTIFSVSSIFVNVTVNESFISRVTLEWNGINQTISCSGISPDRICGTGKTSLPNGVYSFRVYVNDSLGRTNHTSMLTYNVNVVSGGSGGGSSSGRSSGGGFAFPIKNPVVNISGNISRNISRNISVINISGIWKNISINFYDMKVRIDEDDYIMRLVGSNDSFIKMMFNSSAGVVEYTDVNLKNGSIVELGDISLELSLIQMNVSHAILQMRLDPEGRKISSQVTEQDGNTTDKIVLDENVESRKGDESPRSNNILISNHAGKLWIFGSVSLVLLLILFFMARLKARHTTSETLSVKAIRRLEIYISNNLNKGHTEEEIIAAGLRVGWKKEIIAGIIKKVRHKSHK